jgi:hypothetical protein
MENIIMSLKEKEQVVVFEQLKRKEVSQAMAARMLKMSDRWVRKKLKRYLYQGIPGLVHKSRGRASGREWDKKERDFAINLFKEQFLDFEPTYGSEKLKELYNITISRETLRKELVIEGLWKSGKKRTTYRKRRERKPCFGIMIQLDGSPHDWFEGRHPKCTLLVFIDDATSKLVWLEFAQSESADSIMHATRKYFKKHGRPVSFYVDYGSVFSVNTNNPEREKITQFERAMKELNVEVIHARSPQAKGRVERVNRTLQARLTKDMRLAGISTIEAANAFLHNHYIDRHNQKFAEEAAQPGNAHRSIVGLDLHNTFCVKNERVLMQDFTVSYQHRVLQLLQHQKAILRPKDRIVIHEHLDFSLSLWIRGIKLSFEELRLRSRKINNAIDYVNAHRNDDDSINIELSQNQQESRVKSAMPAVEATHHNQPLNTGENMSVFT